jgi:hypothetical protein
MSCDAWYSTIAYRCNRIVALQRTPSSTRSHCRPTVVRSLAGGDSACRPVCFFGIPIRGSAVSLLIQDSRPRETRLTACRGPCHACQHQHQTLL